MEEAKKLCHYCRGSYVGDECLPCERKFWASNRTSGWVILFFLFPFAVAGLLIGIIWSGIRAGIEEGSGLWATAMGFIRKKRP